MAKGFKVKTVAPKTKAPDWDIDAIKARWKGKAIVFCLPGRGCSYIFLKNFVQLCFDMVQNGMSIQISQDYSSMVNFARCKVLGANVLRGPIRYLGMVNYNTTTNYGLTRIQSLTQTSSGNYVILHYLLKVRKSVLYLLVGMLQKMAQLHLSHTGQKKMTSVRMVES